MGCINVTTRNSQSKVRKFIGNYDTNHPMTHEIPPVSQSNDADEFQTLDHKLISHSYSISPQIIGSGYYGKVLLGNNKSKPELQVAIKTLQKKEIGADILKIKNEI